MLCLFLRLVFLPEDLLDLLILRELNHGPDQGEGDETEKSDAAGSAEQEDYQETHQHIEHALRFQVFGFIRMLVLPGFLDGHVDAAENPEHGADSEDEQKCYPCYRTADDGNDDQHRDQDDDDASAAEGSLDQPPDRIENPAEQAAGRFQKPRDEALILGLRHFRRARGFGFRLREEAGDELPGFRIQKPCEWGLAVVDHFHLLEG